MKIQFALAVFLLSLALINAASGQLVVDVSGFMSPAGGSGPSGQAIQQVAGSLDIVRFEHREGQLIAVANLVLNGLDFGLVDMVVDLQQANDSCPILHLVLGPLDLNLLGLVIHLDTIVLDITAIPGPGNLLGNLLCAIAGLLNGNLPPALIDLLNQILELIRGALGGGGGIGGI